MSLPELGGILSRSLRLLKAQMPKGIPKLGIPPLDPLRIDPFDIPPVNEDLIQLGGRFRDVIVHGLATTNFENLASNVGDKCVTLSATLNVQKVKATGEYDLEGVALAFIPLDMKGNATIEANGVSTTITVSWSSSSPMSVQVTMGTISVGRISASFENLEEEGLGEILEELINQLGTQIFDALGPLIAPPIADSLQTLINEELQDQTQNPQLIAALSNISSFNFKEKKPPISMDERGVSQALSILEDISSKWDEIGMKLKIEKNFRDPLRTDISLTSLRKLEEVLMRWVNSHTNGATWDELKTVLEDMSMNDYVRKVEDQMKKLRLSQ